jgi:hypothetical protein
MLENTDDIGDLKLPGIPGDEAVGKMVEQANPIFQELFKVCNVRNEIRDLLAGLSIIEISFHLEATLPASWKEDSFEADDEDEIEPTYTIQAQVKGVIPNDYVKTEIVLTPDSLVAMNTLAELSDKNLETAADFLVASYAFDDEGIEMAIAGQDEDDEWGFQQRIKVDRSKKEIRALLALRKSIVTRSLFQDDESEKSEKTED